MANKLKELLMNSVDFVKRGANQDADIMLYKSIDGGAAGDAAGVIMKSEAQVQEMIQKSADTMNYYAEALVKSIHSVLTDETMSDVEAQEFMAKSLSEFDEAVKNDIISEFTYTNSKPSKTKKTQKESEVEKMNAKDILKSIGKDKLLKEEEKELEKLLEKAFGDDDDDDFPPKKKEGEGPEVNKSAAGVIPPAIQAALDRMEGLAKSIEMNEYKEIAKKYEILGEDPDTLAKSLYDMKQAGEATYNQYIASLDKCVGVLKNSAMFGEIGKSARGGYGSQSEPEAKINSIAKSFMEKDPTLTEHQAMAKAWETHPELAVDYENSRR